MIGFGFEGITILNVRSWLTAHMLIGIALIIPTGVKLASTGYRFARYYTNTPAYVRNGPPRIVLRVLAPFLVLNTAFILLSGVSIPLSGGYRHQVEGLHKLSFATWIVLTGVHVLFYLKRMPPLLIADLSGRGTPRGAALQRLVVVAGGGDSWVRVGARAHALDTGTGPRSNPFSCLRSKQITVVSAISRRDNGDGQRRCATRPPTDHLSVSVKPVADRSVTTFVGAVANRAVHLVLGMGSNLRSRRGRHRTSLSSVPPPTRGATSRLVRSPFGPVGSRSRRHRVSRWATSHHGPLVPDDPQFI